MNAQDCVAIIGAIAAAQVLMIGALGKLYLLVRANKAVLESLASSNTSA